MSDKYIASWFRASLDSELKDVGLFKQKLKRFYEAKSVDYNNYAELLAQKYNEFDSKGYDVVNVIPVTMGEEEVRPIHGTSSREERTPFSITRGAIVVGKKRDEI
ncbi:hypothetical protein O5O45_00490 [Hahella aquimaris]|uniref:hypothetical protein n=1 Tax=Hahella sp. HNIBRBA332 TaxID=3015983 RepID=UPI00273C3D53|nr:hypothetical protein [Hahella sp. HNIBRBA332]WLQ14412.1 hypothetical protein O5O45_00490 [Hahella sp. HNIBRBA332]